MRLIDADELKLSLCRECSLYPDECLEKHGECDWNSIAHINMMKPVDAVKVIRCKDCKHHQGYNCDILYGFQDVFTFMDEDYCSKAERKEE